MSPNLEQDVRELIKKYSPKLKIETIDRSRNHVRIGKVHLRDELETEMTLFVMMNPTNGSIYMSNGANRVGPIRNSDGTLEKEKELV